ncbi:MAG TPA: hypothetical protein VG270_13640 [Pseudolabrys sp.]|nr:hypothetical protein [Pseudolabrys sp.]
MTRIHALCAFVLVSLLFGAPAVAQPVFPPGLRIGLEPPPGMVVSKRFTGFEDPERKAAILILDLPAPAYNEVESSLFAKQTGLENVTRRAFPFNDGIALLAAADMTQNGVSVHKWFFVATTVAGPVPNLTAFVTVEVPDTARSIYTDAVVEKLLKSITFRQPPIDEQLSLLPYRVGERAGFHVRQVMPNGVVILSEKPSGNPFGQAYVVVSISPGGPRQAEDRPLFAQDLLRSAPVRDLAITSGESMRINGAPGSELRATGKDASNAPIKVVQWLRFGTGGFMRIIGISPTAEWDAMFPRFRAVRDGVGGK